MIRLCSYLIISSILLQVEAQALTLTQVVHSSLKHYPKVSSAIYQLEQIQAQELKARGAFDGKIKAKKDSRHEGFYDGKLYQAQISKPLKALNANIYGGYRVSEGIYPDYEGKFNTLNRGESFIGGSLSILRNSMIDLPRYNLKIAEENSLQAKYAVEQTKIHIQTLAIKAYWTWVIKGYQLRVYKELLNLATQRGGNLKRRIKAGDLARIYESENLQYIKKREVHYQESLLEFQEASFYLSLFYRDKFGNPTSVTEKQLPPLDHKGLQKPAPFNKLYALALQKDLNLKKLGSKAQQAQAKIDLGQNGFLPKLDVNYEFSQDRGAGSNTLAQQEQRILLQLEIPLEYRKARGDKRRGKMELQQTKVKVSFLKERLKVRLQALSTKIKTFVTVAKITSDQVELAKKLTTAEWKKFKRGASDLILVNLREENLAESQVKNLEIFLKYQFYKSELHQLLVRYI